MILETSEILPVELLTHLSTSDNSDINQELREAGLLHKRKYLCFTLTSPKDQNNTQLNNYLSTLTIISTVSGIVEKNKKEADF